MSGFLKSVWSVTTAPVNLAEMLRDPEALGAKLGKGLANGMKSSLLGKGGAGAEHVAQLALWVLKNHSQEYKIKKEHLEEREVLEEKDDGGDAKLIFERIQEHFEERGLVEKEEEKEEAPTISEVKDYVLHEIGKVHTVIFGLHIGGGKKYSSAKLAQTRLEADDKKGALGHKDTSTEARDRYTLLQGTYDLAPEVEEEEEDARITEKTKSEEEKEALEKAAGKTDKFVQSFAFQTTHFATMQAIDRFLRIERKEPNFYADKLNEEYVLRKMVKEKRRAEYIQLLGDGALCAKILANPHLHGFTFKSDQKPFKPERFTHVLKNREEYLRILTEKKGETLEQRLVTPGKVIQKKYISTFKPWKQWIIKGLYAVAHGIIGSMVTKTLEKLLSDIREFIRSESSLEGLLERKVSDLADYFGRIDGLREEFLEEKSRPGTFDKFLIQKLQTQGTYGNGEWSEAQLMERARNYIVQEYVPRPDCRIRGKKIPLLSSFLEWLGYHIRKGIVKSVLKRSGVLEGMVEKSEEAALFAQREMKTLVLERVNKIAEMLDSKKEVTESDTEQGAPLISPELKRQIGVFSENLLQFAKIAQADGQRDPLERLSNTTAETAYNVITAVTDFFNVDVPFSVQRILTDATREALETIFKSIFAEKEQQLETSLQATFRILNQAYAPSETEISKQNQNQRKLKADVEDLDSTLQSQLQLISETAITHAVNNQLSGDASRESHDRIVDLVKEEKAYLKDVADELKGIKEKIDAAVKADRSSEVTPLLKKVMGLINGYFQHVSELMASKGFEQLYGDVKGDLNNLHFVLARTLSSYANTLESLAKSNQEVNGAKQDIKILKQLRDKLRDFKIDYSEDDLDHKIEEVVALMEVFENSKEEHQEKFKTEVKQLSQSYQKTQAELDKVTAYEHKQTEVGKLEAKKEALETIETTFAELSTLTAECRRSVLQPEEMGEKAETIKLKWKTITSALESSTDPFLKQHLKTLNKVKTVWDLYRLFHPLFSLRRKPPVMRSLGKLKARYTQLIESQKAELEAKKPPKTREKLEAEIEKQRESLKALLVEIDAKRKEEKTARREKIQDNKKKILEENSLDEMGETFEIYADHLEVTGCLSIGDLKSAETLAGGVITKVSKDVNDGTIALNHELGRAFHTRQLLNRLVLAHVAEF